MVDQSPSIPESAEDAAIAVADGGDIDLGYQVSIDQFSGPLDLLLYLVRRTELEIVDIPITTITDQFVATIAAWTDLDLDVAGDFIVLAATLLEIKARELAPPLPLTEGQDAEEPDEELSDPRADLIRRLLAYRRFKDASSLLSGLETAQAGRVGRHLREAIPEEPEADQDIPLEDLDVHKLFRTFEIIMGRINGLGPRRVVLDEIPIDVRIQGLIDGLQAEGSTTLSRLLQAEPGRGGQAGVLVASLEVVRQRFAEARQLEQYGEVQLRFREAAEREIPAILPPEEPEPAGRRRARPPLITFQAQGASAEEDLPVVEDERLETDEQRFLRELDEAFDLSAVLARAADTEGGFIAHWQERHPGELPPTIAAERAAELAFRADESRRLADDAEHRRQRDEARAAKKRAHWEERKDRILALRQRKSAGGESVPADIPADLHPGSEEQGLERLEEDVEELDGEAIADQAANEVEDEEDPVAGDPGLILPQEESDEDGDAPMGGDPTLIPPASSAIRPAGFDLEAIRLVFAGAAAPDGEADAAEVPPDSGEPAVLLSTLTTGMASAMEEETDGTQDEPAVAVGERDLLDAQDSPPPRDHERLSPLAEAILATFEAQQEASEQEEPPPEPVVEEEEEEDEVDLVPVPESAVAPETPVVAESEPLPAQAPEHVEAVASAARREPAHAEVEADTAPTRLALAGAGEAQAAVPPVESLQSPEPAATEPAAEPARLRESVPPPPDLPPEPPPPPPVSRPSLPPPDRPSPPPTSQPTSPTRATLPIPTVSRSTPMSSTRRFWLLAVGLALINALAWLGFCRWVWVPRALLEVVAPTTVVGATPWAFRFNLDVVGNENLGSAPAILPDLGPAVPGTWAWSDRRTLTFTPTSALPPGVGVRVALAKEALRTPDGLRLGQDLAAYVRTPPLRITGSEVVSFAEDGANLLDLRFSEAVDPQRIDGRIRVTDASGAIHPARPVTAEAAERLRVRIPAGAVAPGHGSVAVTSAPVGDAGLDGPLRLDPSWRGPLVLGHRLALTGAEAKAPASGPVRIAVRLNDVSAPRELLAEALVVEPNISFSVEAGELGPVLVGDFSPGSTYTVRLSARWPEGDRPSQPLNAYPGAGEASVTIPDRVPGLWLEGDLESLHLRGVNCGTVVLTITGTGEDVPVARTIVTLAGPVNQEQRSEVEVSALLASLPPGDYQVRAEAGETALATCTLRIRSVAVAEASWRSATGSWLLRRLTGDGQVTPMVRLAAFGS